MSTASSNINKDSKDSNNNSAAAVSDLNGRSAALERAYVHDVYENCEEPVGSIRPRVASFLSALDAGSIVCDVGCGNGRYLTASCNPSIVTIGVDRCFRLGNVAKEAGGEVSDNIASFVSSEMNNKLDYLSVCSANLPGKLDCEDLSISA